MTVSKDKRTKDHNDDLRPAREALDAVQKKLCSKYDDVNQGVIVHGILSAKNNAQVSPKIIHSTVNNRTPNYLEKLFVRLSEIIAEKNDTDPEIAVKMAEYGQAVVGDFNPRLSRAYMIGRLRSAKRIWIYNTFVPHIEDYAADLAQCPDFKIILMDPESRFLPFRAQELGETVHSVNSSIEHCVNTLLRHNVSENNVLFHGGLPSSPLYVIDEDIFAGFFLIGSLAMNGPQRRFKSDSDDGKALLKQFSDIESGARVCQKGTWYRPPKHTLVQSYIDLFPMAKDHVTPKTLRETGEEHCGTYIFARYRSTFAREKLDKPIIKGISCIYPFNEASGIIRFRDAIPVSDFQSTGKMNDYNGFVIPYPHFITLVGDEQMGKFPIFVVLQRIAEADETFGLVMRRHPAGPILATKIIFKRVHTHEMERFGFSRADSWKRANEDIANGKFRSSSNRLLCSRDTFDALFGLHERDALHLWHQLETERSKDSSAHEFKLFHQLYLDPYWAYRRSMKGSDPHLSQGQFEAEFGCSVENIQADISPEGPINPHEIYPRTE